MFSIFKHIFYLNTRKVSMFVDVETYVNNTNEKLRLNIKKKSNVFLVDKFFVCRFTYSSIFHLFL